MKLLKTVAILLAALLLMVGCKSDDTKTKTTTETTTTDEGDKKETTKTETTTETKEEKQPETATAEGEIHVVSREVGSGTRGAFTEITKILSKNDKGEEVDQTYSEATIVNSTEGVITAVNGDKNGIGYISLGSLNDEVKAVKVDGVEATPENINKGDYKIARPFLIVYHEEKLSDVAKDFLKFIMSKDGQAIVKEDGCISIDTTEEYKAANVSGRIAIAGSTSVTPLMEKLVDKYKELNPGFEADIQSNGSSAGIQAATEGVAELGMSSRNLKPEEEKVVQKTAIAMDGIAVVVNNDNPVDDISLDTIHNIFVGEVKDWKDAK